MAMMVVMVAWCQQLRRCCHWMLMWMGNGIAHHQWTLAKLMSINIVVVVVAVVVVVVRTAGYYRWTSSCMRCCPTVSITLITRTRTYGRCLIANRHVRRHWLIMYLHMLSQRTWMCITLVASLHLTIVRLITRMYVRMFLPIGTVGKPTVTAFIFAFEWFFTYNTKMKWSKRD